MNLPVNTEAFLLLFAILIAVPFLLNYFYEVIVFLLKQILVIRFMYFVGWIVWNQERSDDTKPFANIPSCSKWGDYEHLNDSSDLSSLSDLSESDED